MIKYGVHLNDEYILVQDGIPHKCQKGIIRFFKDGKLHNLDGPAIERDNGDHEYYINGKQYLYKEWLEE